MNLKNITEGIFGNYRKIIKVLLLTGLPLIICYITCLKDGIALSDIYLGNSKWNDEVLYYKITEAVSEFNRPLGNFGYNGSSAEIGHFGAWSPVVFVFYIIYAKIFGWSMMSPIYCNIILMMIAMFVFALFVQPTKKQTIFLCLLYGSCSIITRYVLSGMTEITIYSLLIIFIGISVKAGRTSGNVFKLRYLLILNFLAFLLTLMRPYWILLFVVPAWYWYCRRQKKAILVESGISIVSIAVYFFIANRFCAQYLFPIINLDWLKLLVTSPLQGLYNIMYIFVSSIWKLLQSIGDGIIQGNPMGAMYAIFLMIIVYFTYSIINCEKNDKNKKVYCYGLICLLLLLLAIFYLYDLEVGSRHLTGFILVFILVFSIMDISTKRVLIFLTAFTWVFCIRATDEYTYNLPVCTDEKEAEIADGMEGLMKADLIDVNSDDPWDNTIIWLYSDKTDLDFTYLYALPAGMGINLCFKDYVLANFEQLKSRYIITNIGEEVDLICKNKKKELKVEYGNVHVWKLR